MPLVSRLTRQETVGDMLLAANSRYEEGLSLLDAGHPDGGVYLLGYAAEMILKTSFCRIDATVPPYITVRSRFVVAERLWLNEVSAVLPPGYEHSLLFWERVLPLERMARQKSAMGFIVSRTLSRCVRIVSENWAVKMRYQPSIATAQEADDVRVAVSWLHDNQRTLWS